MRYQVGTPVVALRVIQVRQGFPFVFLPWEDKLREIRIQVLEVVEHHRVPSAHDPEAVAEYDGYILKSRWNNYAASPKLVWYNQYPEASYSQISTEADYRFSPGQLEWEDHLNGGKSLRYPTRSEWIPQMRLASRDERMMAYVEDACQILDRVSRGIRDMNNEHRDQEAAALSRFRAAILTMLTTTVGAKFEESVDELGNIGYELVTVGNKFLKDNSEQEAALFVQNVLDRPE